MNINAEFLQSVISRIFPEPEPEPDIEWIETGDVVTFYRYGDRSCRRNGLIVATEPETQYALIEYYEPGDWYWHRVWIGIDDIRCVVMKGA